MAATFTASRPGGNLCTASVLAIGPKPARSWGVASFTPDDACDYDRVWELILAELPADGVKRKAVMQINRNSFL